MTGVSTKQQPKKTRRSFTPPLASFDENLGAFLERKIPCELSMYYPAACEPDFDQWLCETGKRTEVVECLSRLHSKYGILPAPVLFILAKTKHLFLTAPSSVLPKAGIRRRHRKILVAALAVIDVYRPSFEWPDRAQREKKRMVAGIYLKELEESIGMLRPRKKPNLEMRFCAQALTDFFRAVTGNPLHKATGELMKAAFPELSWAWNPEKKTGSDFRLTALKRAQGPSINARRFTLEEALDLQKQNPDHERFWREKAKQAFSTLLKAGHGKMPPLQP